jgi:menaquinol-cytochrome c reductase iron-sulfur subunit
VTQNKDSIKANNNKLNSSRRTFIKTAALTGVAALVTGVPLASYIVAPSLNKGTGKWIDFGPVEDLNPGSMEMLSYEFMVKDGWLVLPQRGFVWAKTEAGGKLRVFSSTCTHLACNVIWREEEEVFLCPCHSGRFNSDGKNIAGPPTRPLTVLQHKVEEGKLMVFLTV